ncbi:hypothetical protein PR202_gb22066 [Eleusine coracana subsp. coracana]|uniref:polynucleotide adenylyltransferase n=1 Tax=Eleusine coracana subsp. coracana TaxID=191504 RepID=A0AAV5FES8_ELECO|nr:hypothetical protein PR202_gb22066 [Eleusine coracana subsp. coracana]
MSYLATAAPVPYWLHGQQQMGGPFSDLSAAETSPTGSPEPPALPFLLSPTPPPPPGYPLLPPPPPIVIQLDPGFLADVDSRRNSSLVQFLEDEGAVPSTEDDKKREKVIRELKKIVTRWVKEVAYEQSVPPRIVTATVLTYGSYTLGAHGPESDIDALCAAPCFATLQYHFFVVLRQILEGRPEVSEVQTVESAKHLGFFAGIHLAILAAYVCQRYPNASVNGLFTMFFQTFAHWSWQVPVSLHGQATSSLHSEGRLMPIVMPCSPPEFCISNVTKSTFKKIRQEFLRGYALIMAFMYLFQDQLRHDFQWTRLFEPFPYAANYQQFVRIALCSPTSEELRDWAGWVKCRFRNLILRLEKIGIECDPCPLEEMDHTVIRPNIVYYWGLITQTVVPLDAYSLREDFMNDIITDIYGKVKCTQSELTVSLVGLPELPKSMCSDPVYLQYMPYCVMGYPYKAATQDQKAIS